MVRAVLIFSANNKRMEFSNSAFPTDKMSILIITS